MEAEERIKQMIEIDPMAFSEQIQLEKQFFDLRKECTNI